MRNDPLEIIRPRDTLLVPISRDPVLLLCSGLDPAADNLQTVQIQEETHSLPAVGATTDTLVKPAKKGSAVAAMATVEEVEVLEAASVVKTRSNL